MNLQKFLPLVLEQHVEFFVEVADLEFGLEIYLVIVFRAEPVSSLNTVLAHHDDRRLHGGETRQHQIQQNIRIGIEGAEENDFTFIPLLSPVANRLGLKGPIPTDRIIPIIDRYLTGFFQTVLLGTGSAAVESSPYAEVTVEIIDNR